ncbi:MAG: lysophospholipase [Nannocystaceae bacterium]
MTDLDTEESTVTSRDGIDLHVYRWGEPSVARAVVHICHGLAEHAGRYARLGRALQSAGYVAYAHDHRGHGKSASSDDQLGFYAYDHGWDRLLDDVDTVTDWIVDRHPRTPVVLIGHSMGSFAAQHLIARNPGSYHAVVLSGSSDRPLLPLEAGGRFLARAERLRQGPKGRSKLLDMLTFGSYNRKIRNPRTKFDWLSRDEAEVDSYLADPRCGFLATNQLWIDMLDAISQLRPKMRSKIPSDLPLLVMSGDQDPVGEYGKGVKKLVANLRAEGLTEVTEHLYTGGRHEMFNETNREVVTADLLAWLARVLPGDA